MDDVFTCRVCCEGELQDQTFELWNGVPHDEEEIVTIKDKTCVPLTHFYLSFLEICSTYLLLKNQLWKIKNTMSVIEKDEKKKITNQKITNQKIYDDLCKQKVLLEKKLDKLDFLGEQSKDVNAKMVVNIVILALQLYCSELSLYLICEYVIENQNITWVQLFIAMDTKIINLKQKLKSKNDEFIERVVDYLENRLIDLKEKVIHFIKTEMNIYFKKYKRYKNTFTKASCIYNIIDHNKDHLAILMKHCNAHDFGMSEKSKLDWTLDDFLRYVKFADDELPSQGLREQPRKQANNIMHLYIHKAYHVFDYIIDLKIHGNSNVMLFLFQHLKEDILAEFEKQGHSELDFNCLEMDHFTYSTMMSNSRRKIIWIEIQQENGNITCLEVPYYNYSQKNIIEISKSWNAFGDGDGIRHQKKFYKCISYQF